MEGDNPSPEVVQQTATAVDSAITQVEKAAEIPVAAISDVLSGVKDTLVGVQAELKRSNDLREAETQRQSETPSESAPVATAPDVAVEPPAPETHRVRRGHKKVTRVKKNA